MLAVPRLSQHCILVVLISIFLAAMAFSCVHPCKGDFATRPGLTRHQNNCLIFRTSQALKIEHRRIMRNQPHRSPSGSASKGSDGTVTKLGIRKARIGHQGSEFPVSSFKLTICTMINSDSNNSLNSCQAPPLTPVTPVAFPTWKLLL